MEPKSIPPLQSNQRTAIVDILRGWALPGVVIGNYTEELPSPFTAAIISSALASLPYYLKYHVYCSFWCLPPLCTW